MRTPFASVLALLLLAACTPAPGAATLDGTSWRLVDLGGKPPVAGADVTLQFTGDHAEGFASCNQYHAPYTVSGSSLSFGPAISTKRACAEEARNAQEAAYLGVFANVASYSVSGDQLVLSNASGTSLLTFTRAR